MARQTFCLNMIVKNESHIIEQTLENICATLTLDYWVICDTGSTDNTMEIIKNFFARKNIPGELFEEPWYDFGHNRTVALKRAYQKTDYLCARKSRIKFFYKKKINLFKQIMSIKFV